MPPPRKEPKASIGRIVRYDGQAAIIVYVHTDGTTVNLEVFGAFGQNVHRQSVPFALKPTRGHWGWPPLD